MARIYLNLGREHGSAGQNSWNYDISHADDRLPFPPKASARASRIGPSETEKAARVKAICSSYTTLVPGLPNQAAKNQVRSSIKAPPPSPVHQSD